MPVDLDSCQLLNAKRSPHFYLNSAKSTGKLILLFIIKIKRGSVLLLQRIMRKLKTTELNRQKPEEYRYKEKWPVRIILDNVRSLHNIGSVFRTADAFSVEAIYLCGICAVPPNKEIHKTALGATETVAWEYFETTDLAVAKVLSEGYTVVLVEQTDSSISLTDFIYAGEKIALVFGNEIDGVSDSILPLAAAAVEIPQFGTKHSLNISVCAGIVMYELFTNRK